MSMEFHNQNGISGQMKNIGKKNKIAGSNSAILHDLDSVSDILQILHQIPAFPALCTDVLDLKGKIPTVVCGYLTPLFMLFHVKSVLIKPSLLCLFAEEIQGCGVEFGAVRPAGAEPV